MTKEEAAEIILRGEAWRQCPNCEGRGRALDDDPEEPGRRHKCQVCKGEGHLLHADYHEAILLLEMKAPPRPLTPLEKLGQAGGDFIRSRLTEGSLRLRGILPIQQIPDAVLDEHQKKVSVINLTAHNPFKKKLDE